MSRESSDGSDSRFEEKERLERVTRLSEVLGHSFADEDHITRALQHSSFANERARERENAQNAGLSTLVADVECESNERLEFLGDAVLALVVGEALYEAKPDWREGDLTRALHSIVEGTSLTELAKKLNLGRIIRLGRTEEQSGGGDKASILEDAMEAVIGALYLDGGIDAVRRFVHNHFADALAADAVRVERDPKTALQEMLMAEVGSFPSYRMVGDSGVEGDDDRFEVEVSSEGEPLSRGIARTKRGAEKAAARVALDARGNSDASGGAPDE